MASGPYPDRRRGTWAVQWHDGRRWRRVVVVRKRPGWKPGGPMPKRPPPEAIAALAEYTRREQAARAALGAGHDAPRTVQDFLQAHLEGYGVGHAASSATELRKAVAVFLAWCQAEGVGTVDEVTAEVCRRWLVHRARTASERTGRPIAHATLRKERGLLASAWSSALRHGRVAEDPWRRAEVPGKPTARRRGSWSPEEFERLLAAARPWLRDVLLVGVHTGLRISALRGLEWRDVRRAETGAAGFGFVEVRPELDKAAKGYRVPIGPTLHEVLERRRIHRTLGAVHVLTGRRGGPLHYISVTDRAIRGACRRAGLPTPDSPNHHMRRTFGRWAVLGHLTGKPVPLYVVSRWLGHADVQMTQRYLDLGEQDSTRYMLGED